jgi:hypothetical protein
MNLPEEFRNRVCKTKLTGFGSSFRKLDQIRKEWEGSDIDVLYENAKPIVVVVFETQEDCLAFTLKYGKEYV